MSCEPFVDSSHICHIISNLGVGGAEQYVVQLSNALHVTGRRVSIVAGEPQPLSQRLNSAIHVKTLQMHPSAKRSLLTRTARILDDPRVVLLIAGDGPERKYLENLAESLPGRTRIRFLGVLQDPAPAYAAADFYLQTTRGPNLGVVVLEAMASGLPILIAYRDQEERKMALDTFEGQAVGAIAEATPDVLAAKAAELFDDPEKLEQLRPEVHRFVESRHGQISAYAGMAEHYSALERAMR